MFAGLMNSYQSDRELRGLPCEMAELPWIGKFPLVVRIEEILRMPREFLCLAERQGYILEKSAPIGMLIYPHTVGLGILTG